MFDSNETIELSFKLDEETFKPEVYRAITGTSYPIIWQKNANTPSYPSYENCILFNTVNFEIKKVIFNDPATIILWKDGTKTVVKVKPGEKFDKWTGFAMACMKKLKGNDFHAFFRHWCEDKKDEK